MSATGYAREIIARLDAACERMFGPPGSRLARQIRNDIRTEARRNILPVALSPRPRPAQVAPPEVAE